MEHHETEMKKNSSSIQQQAEIVTKSVEDFLSLCKKSLKAFVSFNQDWKMRLFYCCSWLIGVLCFAPQKTEKVMMLFARNENDFYLQHKQDCIHQNKQHDEILKGLGGNQSPDVVPDACRFWRDIQLKWLGLDGKVNAWFLK